MLSCFLSSDPTRPDHLNATAEIGPHCVFSFLFRYYYYLLVNNVNTVLEFVTLSCAHVMFYSHIHVNN